MQLVFQGCIQYKTKMQIRATHKCAQSSYSRADGMHQEASEKQIMAATVNMNRKETFLIYGLLPLTFLKIFLDKIRRLSRERSTMTLLSKMFRMPPCLIYLLPPTRSAMPIFLCALLRMNKTSHWQATTLLQPPPVHPLFYLKSPCHRRMIFAR